MKRVYIAAEGQAEANVINRVLYPYFIQKGIALIPHTIVTSTDYRHGRIHKGGITTYASARNTIVNCLSSAKLECIPNFDKNGAGVDCLIATGLDELRKKCKHFGEWIAWIESLEG